MGWTRALWLFKNLNAWEVPEKKSWHPCSPSLPLDTGREAEGWELELWAARLSVTTQPGHCCWGTRQVPSHTQTPAEGEEKKNNPPRQTVLSKPLSALWRRHKHSSLLAAASRAQPGAGHCSSEAVPQLSQLHRQSIPPRSAEQDSLMPIKQLVLSTCKREEEEGCCCSFKEMFCGNYTARDTPGLPSDSVRKICRQKPKDKTFLIIILALERGFIFTSLYGSDWCCCWGMHVASMGFARGWDPQQLPRNFLLHRRRKRGWEGQKMSCHSCRMAGKWIMEPASRDAQQDPPLPTKVKTAP